MKPLRNKVLIERIQKEKKNTVILVDEPPSKKFRVISIGSDVKSVNENDIVLIDSYGLLSVENEEKKELFIVNEDSIYLVL